MSRVWVILKRLGKVVKFLFVCLVLTVFVFMGWRIFSTGAPDGIKTLIPNEKLSTAYAEKGEELYIFEQKYDDITRAERNSGYFAVPEAVFLPEIDQAQIIFRYNNSTLKHTAEDYSLPSIPSRDEDVYDVTVTVMYDLTPENKDDNDGKTKDAVRFERFFASDMLSAKKTLYNYRKFVFDGIVIDDSVIAVYADFYYVGDLDYDKTPYGSLLIYHEDEENIDYKLTRNDKAAIEAYTGE